MRLNSKFDVLRGWPREGAIDEAYVINQTVAGTDDLLPLGTVFTINAAGKAVAATTTNRSAANAVSTWVVVAGNDDFSSQYTSKVVGLRSNAMFKLDPANIAAGAYPPATKLSFNAGQWKVAVATNQIIGEVIADDTAVDGTITVMYTGGDAASF